MGRPCKTCEHPQREAIDHELVAGAHFRDVAGRYSLNKNSVHRHKLGHLPQQLVRAAEAREEHKAERLLDRIEELCGEAREVLEATKADRKHATSILAIRELRANFELIGKITGEIADRPTTVVNVISSPDWLVVREAVFEVLARHPAAQAEVASRLLELEGTTVERVADRAIGGS